MRLWQIFVTLALLVPGILMLWRIPRCGEAAPRRRVASRPQSGRAFSVIVPARNEALRIPALLGSLARQTLQPTEIIVVDDESTDATAEIARGFGCTVVEAGALPPGWLGKAWACWQGAQAAASPLLLFLDADTVLDVEGCARILAEAESAGGVVTVQPWHRTGSAIERLSLYFNIVVMAAFNSFTVLGSRLRPAGCFGPCILCSRDDYVRIGGHGAVRGSVVEDVELGRCFMAAGIEVRCYGGRRTIEFRMYPEGFQAVGDGWTKNMALGAARTRAVALALPMLWIAGGVSALFFVAVELAVGSGAAMGQALGLYLLAALQVLWLGRKVGNFGPITALVYPLGLAFFLVVVARSLLFRATGRAARWKGRSVGA